MSAAFTKGPWLVHATNRLVCQADGALKAVTVKDGKVEGDDLPNNICLLRDPDEDFSEDETLANGFLIAAAPDLYEACVAVNRCGNGGARLSRSASDAVRRALAKARGEQSL